MLPDLSTGRGLQAGASGRLEVAGRLELFL
jgi:hypothetical protein